MLDEVVSRKCLTSSLGFFNLKIGNSQFVEGVFAGMIL